MVAARFASKEEKEDMLGSFMKKGLTQREAEAETTVQMCVIPFSFVAVVVQKCINSSPGQ